MVNESYFCKRKGLKMNIKINVDPSQLDHSAIFIEQQAMAYDTTYQQLLQDVEMLQNGWQGKDNQMFTNQIQTFEQDFRKMSLLMREYAQFLKQSARAYRDTQNERVDLARHLAGR